ncbi:UDP-N-acetylmuramate dehydrogenase [Winogradskyella sp. DF17]|uniref:UDP-N-acetylenolpyruvoylglucosamine reductase n=1 Tax=Winogradskyella pelagia TaxID=2819984 RepID=A0ABS3SZ90_9FLAO|nr:UDP-N-acetylmuramate dehydrogenase [Winogradskyella sp. DF17]MBO3115782.1 UDP-N-acetylmuramate dehydrogenase [Winogradskyella sp. DF17]
MKVYKDFDLTNYNAYRLKAKCSRVFFPENEHDLLELYRLKRDYILLGNGYNVILTQTYYDEDFIVFNGNFNTVTVDKESHIISAESGATTLDVSEKALEHSLAGVEFYFDIPSSIGGAVVMNAGTKEGNTQSILMKVRYLDLADMTVKEKHNEDLELTYRNSLFQKQKDKVILKAWFQLQKGDAEEIKTIMEESKARRWAKQPRDYPNCGSVYKRPPGRFVGPMLDELGLKGYRVGDAEISKKHSGFIVNVGNATGPDILDLIRYTKERVKETFGVDLEVEQRII